MFTYITKSVSIFAVTTALLAGSISTSAQAGQSCFELEGQALSDCIDKLIDELSDASNKRTSSEGGPAISAFSAGDTGGSVMVRGAASKRISR